MPNSFNSSLFLFPRRSMATPTPTPTPTAPKSLFLARHYLTPPPSLHLHLRLRRTFTYPAVRCCVFSGGGGGGGGGVADEFVDSRLLGGGASQRQFSALADVVLGIEPLDTQVVGKGVSAAARDAMKRTISAMLGLLPSHQFHVSVLLFSRPLHQLLLSSLITGYTLWNADYRMSLIRNYHLSPQNNASHHFHSIHSDARQNDHLQQEPTPQLPTSCHARPPAHQTLGNLPSAAQSYIANMEAQLLSLQNEIDAHKCENLYLEHNREDSNDLLEYLRSLDPPMIYELSKPSSSEVEGIVHRLAQSIHHKFLLSKAHSTDETDDSGAHTSRDHLAKMLFWCMLMGHHLRGLEYRLHLSWVI